MIVKNYDVNENLFEPDEIVLDLKYIYTLLKKYIDEVN